MNTKGQSAILLVLASVLVIALGSFFALHTGSLGFKDITGFAIGDADSNNCGNVNRAYLELSPGTWSSTNNPITDSVGAVCFNMTLANAVLNCNGSLLNYSGGQSTPAVITYASNVTVENCIISNYATGIKVNASSSRGVLFNNSLIGNGAGNGIDVCRTNGVFVQNCTVSNYTKGIYAQNTINASIANNILLNSSYGIYTNISNYSAISGNSLVNDPTGIFIDGGSYNNVSFNFINSSSSEGIAFDGNPVIGYSNNNNAAFNNSVINSNLAFIIEISNNDTAYNNFVLNNSVGFELGAASAQNAIFNNTISNNLRGMHLAFSLTYGCNRQVSMVSNAFSGNTIDIASDAGCNSTLVVTNAQNQLTYSSKFINVTGISNNIFLNNSIVAVNSSAAPSFNSSANVTLAVASCPAPLYMFENFTTDRNVIINNGTLCTNDNVCHNKQCSGNVLTFNVDHFSSFSTGTCINPTDGMNITEDTLFCPGTFNLPNGINVNASNIVVLCNNTLFNGSGVNNGIVVQIVFNNITINNCAMQNYNRGFLIASANNTLSNNSAINNTDTGFLIINGLANNMLSNNSAINNNITGIRFVSVNSIISSNNIVGNNQSGIWLAGSNNTVINNLVSGNINQDILVQGQNHTIMNNSLSNSAYGVRFSASSGNIIANNVWSNNSIADIFSGSFNNTLILNQGQNQLAFYNAFINVTSINNNIFLNNSIVAVNTVAEPALNTSANLLLVAPSCALNIYRSGAFYKSIDIVKYDAQPCTTCSQYVCANNIVNFSVSEFSTVFVDAIPNITAASPNGSGQFQPISANDTNVTNNVTLRTNITFNVSASDVDSDLLTFNWFVDQVLQFFQDITNFFTGIFSAFTFNFTSGGQHNVTVVVSDVLGANKSITYDVNVSCANDDADGDGFFNTAGCGVLDCNDNNASIRPPRDNEFVNSNVQYCPGTYSIPTGIRINKSGISVSCNDTIFAGDSQITSPQGIYVNNLNGVIINGCTAINYNRGFHIQSGSNIIVRNSLGINDTYGLYVHHNSASDLIFNNTFTNNTQYGIFAADNVTVSNFTGNNFQNNVIKSIASDASSKNLFSLISQDGISEVSFIEKSINLVNSSNVYLNNSIAAINTSIEQGLNQSALVQFSNISRCPQTIYFNDSFITDRNTVIAQGNVCDETNLCHNISCSANTLQFTVDHFSTFASNFSGCEIPTDGMNVFNSTNFCPGTFNVPNGIIINSSNIVINCSNTVFNGTGVGISIANLNNITIYGCNLTKYTNGIAIVNSQNTVISGNSIYGTINALSAAMPTSVLFTNIINNKIFNNTEGLSLSFFSSSTVTNNSIYQNQNGIIMGTIANNNLFSENTFANNSDAGIYFSGGPVYGAPNHNIINSTNLFDSNAHDILTITFVPALNTLMVGNSSNSIVFTDKTLNVNSINKDIFLNDSIAAINTTADAGLNLSANITLNVTKCPSPIYFSEGVFTTKEQAINNGAICDDSTFCHSISCTGNTITFNADRFSSYASGCINPTDGMIITGSLQLCPGTFNLPDGINISAPGVNLTCDGTVINGSANAITINNSANVLIDSCNLQNLQQNGVYAASSINLTVKNTVINNSNGTGIFVDHVGNSVFINDTISNTSESAIAMNSGQAHSHLAAMLFNSTITDVPLVIGGLDTGSIVQGNIFQRISEDAVSIDTSSIIIDSNQFLSTNNSVILAQSSGNVTNNLFSGASITAISMTSTGAYIFNNTFVDNGQHIDILSGSGSNVFANNTFQGNGSISMSESGVQNITGNLFNNSNFGVNIGRSGANVLNNVFLNTTTGISSTQATAVVANNTFIYGTVAASVGGSSFQTIANNTFINMTNAIRLFSPGSTISNNVYNNNTQDIFSTAVTNSLVLSSGQNVLAFYNKLINVTSMSNLLVNSSIAAVNSSAEPQMNVSANITFTVPDCNATLLENPDFYASISSVPSAAVCTDCANITCSGNLLSFNANHFTTMFAYENVSVTNWSINYGNGSVEQSPTFGIKNVSRNIPLTNATFSITAKSAAPLTVQWFVNGISSFIETLTSFFTSMFSFLFNQTGEYNITAVINDTFTNDSFTFHANVTCPGVDNDGDGFYTQLGCSQAIDCNDNDPNVFPPAQGLNINRTATLCPGTYNVPSAQGLVINTSNVMLTCNNTILIGPGGSFTFGITLANAVNITVKGCNISTFWENIALSNASSNIVSNTMSIAIDSIFASASSNNYFFNNTISDSYMGIHFQGGVNNTVSNSTITRSALHSIQLQNGNNFITSNTLVVGSGEGIDAEGSGNIISGNFVTNMTSNGILVLSSSNNISNNVLMNSGTGINLNSNNSIDNVLDSNSFSNNAVDILSTDAGNNTLILTQARNKLKFNPTFLNVSSMNNLFINDSIVAVNTSAEPAMNVPANVSFAVSNCNNSLALNSGFYRSVQSVPNINACTNCSNIVCTDNIMNFTASEFSTIFAVTCTIPTDNLVINNSITFCPGIYNATGISTSQPNITITCNNTVLGNNPFLTTLTLLNDNVTITGCIIENTFTAITTGGALNGIKIANNLLLNSSNSGMILQVANSTIMNNTIFHNPSGITIISSSNNIIVNNTIINNTNSGILFLSASNNTVLFDSSLRSGNAQKDIDSSGVSINNLVITNSSNSIAFYNKSLVVKKLTNLITANAIAAVNSSAESVMNTSATITMAGFSSPAVPAIYRFENFTTNSSTAIDNGTVCNSNNGCFNITYRSNILKFSVNSFSTYAAKIIVVPTVTPTHGGGGPSAPITACVPNYNCTDWSTCVNGDQSRKCNDLNGCTAQFTDHQSCESLVQPNIPSKPVVQQPAPAPTPIPAPVPAPEQQPSIFKNDVLIGTIMGAILLFIVLSLVAVERLNSPAFRFRNEFDVKTTKGIIRKTRAVISKDKKVAVRLYNDAVRAYYALTDSKKKIFEKELKNIKHKLTK